MRRLLAILIVTFAIHSPRLRADDIQAESILQQTGSGKGIFFVAGEGGDVIRHLAKQSQWTIFVQLEKHAEADALRHKLDVDGLLGKRVFVQVGPLTRLHLADDLADVFYTPLDGWINEQEVLRVIRPKGKAIVAAKTLTKDFRAGTDDWSHPYHKPDNNPQSNDVVARRPYLTHFLAEPWYCPLPMMSVIAGGRVFKVFGDRSSARPQEPLISKLVAMNAFNATQLWQRDLSPGFMIHRNTLIATADTLFLGDDKSCQMIDAATGKLRDEIIVPQDKSDGPVWKWMGLEDGVLYALVGQKEAPDEPLRGERIRGAGWPWWKIKSFSFGIGKNLFAFDAKTKKLLWHHHEEDPIDARGIAMRDGKIYFHSEGKHLACLDAKKGTLLWRNSDRFLLEALGETGAAQHPFQGFASTAYLKCSDDAVYFAGPQRARIVAASAKDGKLLWQRPVGNSQLVLRNDGLYALGEGRINAEPSSFKLEPLTGKVLATFPSRDRCTRATGCFDSIFTRGGKGGSTAVFDVETTEPKMGTLSPMRPACQDGVVTAHGYLFWGPWMCRCDMTQLGVISLGPGGNFDYKGLARDEDRLDTRGIGALTQRAVHQNDWPAYRRGNDRRVVTEHVTPPKVQLLWTAEPKTGALPTAPLAVNDLIYVAAQDGAIRALEADSGKVRWTAYTGGQIKYPPAITSAGLFVGAGDGHIYAFDSATGKLRWRFRAAPVERTIPVYGHLTSTWPLAGGVLVENGVVYAAAGISNFDGTHVFALDAETGKIRWQQHSDSYEGERLPMGGVSVQGPMLLHSDAVHMASGNTPPLASYALADGKFEGSTLGRGKDLFIRQGKVNATGFPLFWRPDDDQFLSTMELESPHGILQVGIPPLDPTAPSKLALFQSNANGDKGPELWSMPKLFQEVAGVAFTKNAILLTGVNRVPKETRIEEAALVALDPANGKPMWKLPLPGVPTAWGLALDREGRIIVTMMDGKVAAFGK